MGSVEIYENISDVQKFTYLKSFLVDAALATVSELNLNAENYKEAIYILEKRYCNVHVFYGNVQID